MTGSTPADIQIKSLSADTLNDFLSFFESIEFQENPIGANAIVTLSISPDRLMNGRRNAIVQRNIA
jgi:hypothetical protein